MQRFKKVLATMFLLALIYFPPLIILLSQGYGTSSWLLALGVIVPVAAVCLLMSFVVEWFES